jgi:hypothetical protein
MIGRPIVVSEFPKSGGSWIVSMIGEALQIPRRDIYMRPGFDLFDFEKHPWYRDERKLDFPDVCVIKSHELPNSPLINFDAIFVHLIRDGRDVVVSKYFYERDFCVQNGIISTFEKEFDAYVGETAQEWAKYVSAWSEQKVETIRYEDFLTDPVVSLGNLLKKLVRAEWNPAYLDAVVTRFTRDKFAKSLSAAFKHNTFVRKGISGDWRNHFSQLNVDVFNRTAGDILLSLGYEEHANCNK